MKDFTGLVLCDYRSERVEVHVKATIANGQLTLSGQDLGPVVESFWGDSDYEYWYTLDKDNTAKLISAIHGEEDVQGSLLREFSGESGCKRLRDICEQNGIQYQFFSYA